MEFLKNLSLFEKITEQDFNELSKKLTKVNLVKNEILMKQGEIGTHLYFLEKGELEVFITGPNNYIHKVDNLKPYAIIGEMELFDKKPLIATVKAYSSCILYKISYSDFNKILLRSPYLNQEVISIILSKWRNVEKGIHHVIASMSRSNEYLGNFAATVGHDLKTPLQTLSGYTQILTKICDDHDDKINDYLNRMDKAIHKMNQMIEGIYKYSITIQNLPKDLRPVNIQGIINEVCQHVNLSDEVILEIVDPLPIIFANKIHFIQIFQNLIDNAKKHLNKTKKLIRIECKSDNDFWTFSVHDNGVGIKSDDLKSIMKIFKRVESDETDGYGIGLAIVERLVILYGGDIWVESVYGEGSIFYFTISKSILQYMNI